MIEKNKKIIRFLSITLLLLLSVYVPVQTAFEPYNGTPLTIAHDFLDIEKPFGANNGHIEYINRLINKAIKSIAVKESYTTEEAIKTLLQIHLLLKNEGFVFKPNFLLNKGVETKGIDCDTYSALYTSIAEILRLPVIPVYAPNHSFMRFNFDDGTYLNWDPVDAKPYPDAYYIKLLNISDQSIQKGVYLKSLSRKEFIGVEYNNIGAYLLTGRKFQEALSYFDTSLQLYPEYSSAYHNRGSAYYGLKQIDKAYSDLMQAKKLDPMRASTYNTLGDIYFDKKEYNKALDHYTESIRLDPDFYVPYYSIGLIMKLSGKEKEAKDWFKKSDEIKKKTR